MNPAVRPPAVAGTFYADDPSRLAADVAALLAAEAAPSTPRPKAIVAPHAGYVYSGPAAAAVYAGVAPWRDSIRRVVLLGPTHRVAVRGLAAPSVDYFATPLGDVPIDRAALSAVADLPQVVESDAAHGSEHSLEVQLPFLQQVLEHFTLAPFAVGQCSAEAVAEVLERLWGGDETLIVVSTDLSHFLPYEAAREMDGTTCERILHLSAPLHPEQACGAYPLNGLLLAARQHGLVPRLMRLCNSGDTAGDRRRVVGYGAFAFYEPEPPHGRG